MDTTAGHQGWNNKKPEISLEKATNREFAETAPVV
jgi:hypothetical protein